MKTTIEWNANFFGVEIQTDDMHFVVDANPSCVMNWYDAVRFYKDNKVWQLPTREHLKLIAEHIGEINTLIKANGGYEIQGYYWTADECNEFCAWVVTMHNGFTGYSYKYYLDYVRAVSALSN
ncbi:MAG: DUF1566 domain-containing protein [Alistipes sp.]|nr:DUF1566 domain-containing protein [Alistipes sp.]